MSVRPLSQALEQLWDAGHQPDPLTFLDAAGHCSTEETVAVLSIDQWRRWHAGERVPAEDYLRRFPQLAPDADATLELVYGEYLIRQELREQPTAGEYLGRFPSLAAALGKQFALGEAIDSDSRCPTPPPVAAIQIPGLEILEEVGRGGMGVVYKARQVNLDRVVAVKMILAGRLASGKGVQRFQREARLAATLNHPHIVSIFEVGEHLGVHYFTMPFVEGPSLTTLIRGRGVLPWRESLSLLRDVASAVQFAHENGVVHRDLKPDNVLIDAQGRPRITDFGLARHLTDTGTLTGLNQILGTPAYMAPEQATGTSSAIGPAADIYALGGILYFLLTGQPPFAADSFSATLRLVAEGEPTPPQVHNPEVPTGLQDICLKCLRKDPSKRYPSAQELRAVLREWQRESKISTAKKADSPLPTPATQPSPATAAPRRPFPSGVSASAFPLYLLRAGWRLLAYCTNWASRRARPPESDSAERGKRPPWK